MRSKVIQISLKPIMVTNTLKVWEDTDTEAAISNIVLRRRRSNPGSWDSDTPFVVLTELS